VSRMGTWSAASWGEFLLWKLCVEHLHQRGCIHGADVSELIEGRGSGADQTLHWIGAVLQMEAGSSDHGIDIHRLSVGAPCGGQMTRCRRAKRDVPVGVEGYARPHLNRREVGDLQVFELLPGDGELLGMGDEVIEDVRAVVAHLSLAVHEDGEALDGGQIQVVNFIGDPTILTFEVNDDDLF
jgi:hypothetical protein